jgi:hypothetical protein
MTFHTSTLVYRCIVLLPFRDLTQRARAMKLSGNCEGLILLLIALVAWFERGQPIQQAKESTYRGPTIRANIDQVIRQNLDLYTSGVSLPSTN